MIMKTDKYTFQPEFQNVIQDAVQSLCTALPGILHSIYVYGSVAEGRAVLGRSDLDLTLGFAPAAQCGGKNHSPLSGQSTDRASQQCVKNRV